MNFLKIVKVEADTGRVEVELISSLWLEVQEAGDKRAVVCLTPSEARKIARGLRKGARRLERQQAKA